jgi:hypothetical protein
MSHQRVQFPPERTLISILNHVPEGVRALHEGMKVSLWAERYTLEVRVPWDLPRTSLTEPFLTVTPFSAPAERVLDVEYSPKLIYDPLAAFASPETYKSRQADTSAAATKVTGKYVPLTKNILQSRTIHRTF